MAINLKITSGNSSSDFTVDRGANLLAELQKNGLSVNAPCGGNGKCKKCLIDICEDGSSSDDWTSVLACQTTIENDLWIRLPEKVEAQIQSESYFPDIPLAYDSYPEGSIGISVDIGTTTIVVFLEDLFSHRNLDHASFLNPQNSFGADVISRIQFASTAEQLKKLQEPLIAELNKNILSLCSRNQLKAESVVKVCLTGNTTMLHLFAGADPSSLAVYPFTPAFLSEEKMSVKECGLSSVPEAEITLLPSLSAFVGADIIAGIASTEIPDEEDYSMFIDIGTNGEMALGNKVKILCCATAAGPAFEGAKISCGLGGVSGAIHSFSEEGFQTIGQTKAIGLCGSGLIDVIAFLLRNHQLDYSGYLEQDIHFLEHSELKLTPQDIREVQLAKGAIAAGIQTLINKVGVNINQISKIYLAGGFGFAINPDSAIAIGLLPEEFRDKIIRAGNTAGLGSRLFLHSSSFRERLRKVALEADHFDLSTDMYFNEQFVMNMQFPD